MNIKRLNEQLNEFIEDSEVMYGVEVRNMHDALHYIFTTDNEEHAQRILDICIDLEDEAINEDEAFNLINEFANDTLEIDYREVENGMYQNIKLINYKEPKAYIPDLYF